MAKKSPQRSFNDVLSVLGSQRFDVAPAQEGAKRTPNAFQVRKYGCAAEIAAAPDGTVLMLSHPGWVLNGEISRLLDKLRAIHEFSEELSEATGATSLYNQSLGTTSDVYMYDRVKGRA
jgi:hypothetical protein